MTPATQDLRVEPRKVLIVDDDEDLRLALVELLSCEGVAAAQAVDGLDALERVCAGKAPCAIVLDLDMPRLSGRALAAALRADPRLARIPLVTMTAAGMAPALAGAEHLAKPFDIEALLATLYRICRRCGGCDAATSGTLLAARRRAEREDDG